MGANVTKINSAPGSGEWRQVSRTLFVVDSRYIDLAKPGNHTAIVVRPDLAGVLLKTRPSDRNVRQKRVDYYAALMAGGEWVRTSTGLGFDWNGQRNNGQHRLLACIQAGVPFVTDIATGLDPAAYCRGEDDVTPRTVNDHVSDVASRLAAEHGKIDWNGKQMAGAIAWVWRLMNGDLATTDGPTSQWRRAWLEENWRMGQSYEYMRKLRIGRLVRTVYPMFMAVHFFAAKRNQDAADEFFRKVAEGDAKKGEPAHALHDWFLKERNRTRKSPPQMQIGAIIKAWDAYMRGRSMKSLSVRLRKDTGEPIGLPRIV